MLRHLLTTSLVLLGLIICSGCAAESQIFTESDNGRSVAVNKGDKFTITLESNPTTGYVWAVESVDTSIITHDSQFSYESQSDLVGGGGAESIVFEAVSSGETTIQLKYWRSFEPDNPPIETFSITVIRPDSLILSGNLDVSKTYRANLLIKTEGSTIVSDSADVRFISGDLIRLKSGFRVGKDAKFRANEGATTRDKNDSGSSMIIEKDSAQKN